MMLPSFAYDFQSGPFEAPKDIEQPCRKGNCRRAVQVYFYVNHGLWLLSKQVLCPALYRSTGVFVEPDLLKGREGDVLLAERIRNKDGSAVDRSRSFYATEDEWILYMHSAILVEPRTGKNDARIWHATSIVGGTCEWSGQEFERYYRVAAIKRMLNEDSN